MKVGICDVYAVENSLGGAVGETTSGTARLSAAPTASIRLHGPLPLARAHTLSDCTPARPIRLSTTRILDSTRTIGATADHTATDTHGRLQTQHGRTHAAAYRPSLHYISRPHPPIQPGGLHLLRSSTSSYIALQSKDRPGQLIPIDGLP